MADREAQQKLYAYGEMSNKVQQADRSSRRIRAEEGTGEVESLRSRAGIGRMGDRISSNSTTAADEKASKRSAEVEEIMQRAKKKRQKREDTGGSGSGKKRRAGESILMSSGGQSILDMGELDGYQPTHAASRASYENLLVRFVLICSSRLDVYHLDDEAQILPLTKLFKKIHFYFLSIECNPIQKLPWQPTI